MEFSVVYITATNRDEALGIARVLVGERLVACANVLDSVTSLYWWKDAVQADNEAILISKTRSDHVDRIIERVKELHSYECPCIVSWPITQGSPEYLSWLADETSQSNRIP